MTDPRFEDDQENIAYRNSVNAIWNTAKTATDDVNFRVSQGTAFETAIAVWSVPVDDAIALFETLPAVPEGLEDWEAKADFANVMLEAIKVEA